MKKLDVEQMELHLEAIKKKEENLRKDKELFVQNYKNQEFTIDDKQYIFVSLEHGLFKLKEIDTNNFLYKAPGKLRV